MDIVASVRYNFLILDGIHIFLMIQNDNYINVIFNQFRQSIIELFNLYNYIGEKYKYKNFLFPRKEEVNRKRY